MAGSVVAGSARPADDAFLTSLPGLDAGDVARVSRGEAVAHGLDTHDGREIALAAAACIHASPDFIAAQMRNITTFRQGTAVLRIGTFSADPRLADVAGLALTAEDARKLRGCRRGDCDLQLPAAAIDRLQHVRWEAADAVEQVNRIVRDAVLEIARTYTRGGGLPVYVDDSAPTDVGREFRDLIESAPQVLNRFPVLATHVRRYPQDRRPDIDDVLYWSKEKIGPRQIISVTHLSLWRTGGMLPATYVSASR